MSGRPEWSWEDISQRPMALLQVHLWIEFCELMKLLDLTSFMRLSIILIISLYVGEDIRESTLYSWGFTRVLGTRIDTYSIWMVLKRRLFIKTPECTHYTLLSIAWLNNIHSFIPRNNCTHTNWIRALFVGYSTLASVVFDHVSTCIFTQIIKLVFNDFLCIFVHVFHVFTAVIFFPWISCLFSTVMNVNETWTGSIEAVHFIRMKVYCFTPFIMQAQYFPILFLLESTLLW